MRVVFFLYSREINNYKSADAVRVVVVFVRFICLCVVLRCVDVFMFWLRFTHNSLYFPFYTEKKNKKKEEKEYRKKKQISAIRMAMFRLERWSECSYNLCTA